MYLSRLTKAALDERFTFIDFEDAEIVIRFPGDRYHRGMQWELKGVSLDDLACERRRGLS